MALDMNKRQHRDQAPTEERSNLRGKIENEAAVANVNAKKRKKDLEQTYTWNSVEDDMTKDVQKYPSVFQMQEKSPWDMPWAMCTLCSRWYQHEHINSESHQRAFKNHMSTREMEKRPANKSIAEKSNAEKGVSFAHKTSKRRTDVRAAEFDANGLITECLEPGILPCEVRDYLDKEWYRISYYGKKNEFIQEHWSAIVDRIKPTTNDANTSALWVALMKSETIQDVKDACREFHDAAKYLDVEFALQRISVQNLNMHMLQAILHPAMEECLPLKRNKDHHPEDTPKEKDQINEAKVEESRPLVKEGGLKIKESEPQVVESALQDARVSFTNNFDVGDRVGVRDSSKEEWKPGRVEDLEDGIWIRVKPDGWDAHYRWKYCKHLDH